ncbi:MAG: DUF262 domain-containing protein [Caulobacter sp.]|nr:DUF262 domain-containing protein [Caulobacter sp.]
MTAASVESYLTIVKAAYDGGLKLPAFQRDWKWRPQQVALLFDSLRQGFPIGSFLFMEPAVEIDFSPRSFRGAKAGSKDARTTALVLDGQQRITAGLELFYGTGSKHCFLDLRAIRSKAERGGVDPLDKEAVKRFLSNLDVEDGYFKRLVSSPDPAQHLTTREYLYTGALHDEDELTRSLAILCKAYPENSDFYNFVIGRNFRPSSAMHIPITTIPGDVSVEAISRIFATLNSTGRILSPFELVVAVLFPKNIELVEDVQILKELYPHYKRVDDTGEILLQTIALFAGKDTRKAGLPKVITAELYREHYEDAAKYLDLAAAFVSDRLGVGLDASDELLVYPVIYPPLAHVLRALESAALDAEMRGIALRRLEEWYIGAILDRRYQQSTHDKQARDKADMLAWAIGSGEDRPQWLNEAYVAGLASAQPSSAKGKLLRSLLNRRDLRDPLTRERVGVGAGRKQSGRHHIYPTRWVHHLTGWDKEKHTNNVVLNIMYVEEATNSTFLNFSPRDQVEQSIKVLGEAAAREVFLQHGITSTAFDILRKPNPTVDDYASFIAEREAYFALMLESNGFRRPLETAASDEELDDD